MTEAMEIEKYCAQITDYFTEHLIENGEVTAEELSDEIRKRLMLIEDAELRSKLVRQVLDDLREMSLIYKYKEVYRSPGMVTKTVRQHNGTIDQLIYQFQRLI